METDTFQPHIRQPGTLLPGDLVMGCLSLGDTPELVNAMNLLESVPPEDHDAAMQRAEFRHAAEVVANYVRQALISPEGRRLYPKVATQTHARSPE